MWFEHLKRLRETEVKFEGDTRTIMSECLCGAAAELEYYNSIDLA